MSNTSAATDTGPIRPNLKHYELKVSAYDRVSGMLLALLVLIGSSVLALLIIWLTSRIFPTQAAVPIVFEEIGEGGGAMGDSLEMESPSMDETDLVQPELTDKLSAVTDAVAACSAILENPALYAEMAQKGSGSGDGRMKGSGPGRAGRPRHWEVRFIEGNTVETYARQLDFFKIELGILLPGNKVNYVYNLVKSKPDSRIGPADTEERYYLTWRRGGLQEADRQLLQRAGVKSEGRLILKFIPRELEGQLVGMERGRAGNQANDVRATYFNVVPDGRGYKFNIIDQTYN